MNAFDANGWSLRQKLPAEVNVNGYRAWGAIFPFWKIVDVFQRHKGPTMCWKLSRPVPNGKTITVSLGFEKWQDHHGYSGCWAVCVQPQAVR